MTFATVHPIDRVYLDTLHRVVVDNEKLAKLPHEASRELVEKWLTAQPSTAVMNMDQIDNRKSHEHRGRQMNSSYVDAQPVEDLNQEFHTLPDDGRRSVSLQRDHQVYPNGPYGGLEYENNASGVYQSPSFSTYQPLPTFLPFPTWSPLTKTLTSVAFTTSPTHAVNSDNNAATASRSNEPREPVAPGTRNPASRQGHPRPPAWTEEELEHARQLRAMGWSLADVADDLGRTVSSVMARLWRDKGGDPKLAQKARKSRKEDGE